MVYFIRKRLQVFVSSTFNDLKHERQAAVEAILTAGHIPAGMELFTSGDESQMEVIKQWIEESDVYLLILGAKYGSAEPITRKSYTQLEYEYAVSLGKPLFACVINDKGLNNLVQALGVSALENDNPQELKDFRDLVMSKLIRFWEDAKDIKIAVGETLSNFARRDDLIGWVRAHEEANMPALADEIARLSKENAQLRSLVSTQSEESITGITFLQLKSLLQEKELLNDVSHFQELFRGKIYLSQESLSQKRVAFDEFCLLGLIDLRWEFGEYCYYLTDAGRIFLNKLRAEQLNS
jgi:hypothetical protein